MTKLTEENYCEELIKKIQPKYTLYISKFSKSYLKGSLWYLGDDLMEWWRKSNTVRYYEQCKNQLECIEIIVNL